MDLIRKIPKKFTKKFGNKVINRQYFCRKTGLKRGKVEEISQKASYCCSPISCFQEFKFIKLYFISYPTTQSSKICKFVQILSSLKLIFFSPFSRNLPKATAFTKEICWKMPQTLTMSLLVNFCAKSIACAITSFTTQMS